MSIARIALAAALALSPLGFTLSLVGSAQAEETKAREIEIIVDGGYQPNQIVIQEGERVRLKFVRREYTSCTREVVFPSLDIRRELSPNQPVYIDLPALKPGEVEFRCGMNMVRGKVVVEAHAHK